MSSSDSDAALIRTRRLVADDREAALTRLARDARSNLMLLDVVDELSTAEVMGAFHGDALCGILALRPSVLVDAEAEPDALEPLARHLDRLGVGLIRSPEHVVGPLWERLAWGGRRALVDRIEIAYAVTSSRAMSAALPAGASVRQADEADLEELVVAARASLREEGRPDPYHGDPEGFRRWVRGRMQRARVVECDGRIVFVAYADVQRSDGWLLQGVYTWPDRRRKGFAAAGTAALCASAFEAGADHVQLAVVRGNHAAEKLYEQLGFEPFGRLRTILFG